MKWKKKIIMNLIDKWNEIRKFFFKMKNENKMMEEKN